MIVVTGKQREDLDQFAYDVVKGMFLFRLTNNDAQLVAATKSLGRTYNEIGVSSLVKDSSGLGDPRALMRYLRYWAHVIQHRGTSEFGDKNPVNWLKDRYDRWVTVHTELFGPTPALEESTDATNTITT